MAQEPIHAETTTTLAEHEVAEIIARAEAPLLGPAEAWLVLSVTVNLRLVLAWWRWARGGWAL